MKFDHCCYFEFVMPKSKMQDTEPKLSSDCPSALIVNARPVLDELPVAIDL